MLILVVFSLAIVASKAALSCNGVFMGETFHPAGVCQGHETAEHTYTYQHVCNGGKMHLVEYSTSDCAGVPLSERDACLNQDDCTSICDQDPCEYIKMTSYQGVTSCDPIVLNSATSHLSTSQRGILGQCFAYSDDYSAFYSCDYNDSSAGLHYYSSNDCTGDLSYDQWFLDSCDADTGLAYTYSCDIANEPIIINNYNSFLTQTPETITEQGQQESCDNECVSNNDEWCSPFTKVHTYITYCEYCFKNDGLSSECRKMDENGEYKWKGTEFEEGCFIEYCVGKGAPIENCDKIGINVTKYKDEGCGCNMLLCNDASSFGIFVVMVFVCWNVIMDVNEIKAIIQNYRL